jgi:hypothetical protein
VRVINSVLGLGFYDEEKVDELSCRYHEGLL